VKHLAQLLETLYMLYSFLKTIIIEINFLEGSGKYKITVACLKDISIEPMILNDQNNTFSMMQLLTAFTKYLTHSAMSQKVIF
jgi:hypothetical protein